MKINFNYSLIFSLFSLFVVIHEGNSNYYFYLSTPFVSQRLSFFFDRIIYYLIQEILEEFLELDNAIKKTKKFGILRTRKSKTLWIVAAWIVGAQPSVLKNVWWRKRNYQPSVLIALEVLQDAVNLTACGNAFSEKQKVALSVWKNIVLMDSSNALDYPLPCKTNL